MSIELKPDQQLSVSLAKQVLNGIENEEVDAGLAKELVASVDEKLTA